MTTADVRTTVSTTEVTDGGYKVTIGMNHRITVTSRGSEGTPLNEVIQDAVRQLGLSGSDAEILDENGNFTQNVIVNGERVDDPAYVVNDTANVYVDQRKRNG